MATISNQRLAVQENLPNGNVRATVTCRVSFTTLERNLMGIGLRFRLSCKLWSDDPSGWLLDGDDVLYSFSPNKIYPDTSPAAIENVTFTSILKSSRLNEDNSIFEGYEDEVYAQISLRNLETNTEVKKNTNTIKHHF